MKKSILFFLLFSSLSPYAFYPQEVGASALYARESASNNTVEEVNLTPEELEDYYGVYKKPEVRYLRQVFNAYLKNSDAQGTEFEELKTVDKRYYKSKFIKPARKPQPFKAGDEWPPGVPTTLVGGTEECLA